LILLGLNSEQSMRKIQTFFYLIPKKGINFILSRVCFILVCGKKKYSFQILHNISVMKIGAIVLHEFNYLLVCL
jgi:hypothetical protein